MYPARVRWWGAPFSVASVARDWGKPRAQEGTSANILLNMIAVGQSSDKVRVPNGPLTRCKQPDAQACTGAHTAPVPLKRLPTCVKYHNVHPETTQAAMYALERHSCWVLH